MFSFFLLFYTSFSPFIFVIFLFFYTSVHFRLLPLLLHFSFFPFISSFILFYTSLSVYFLLHLPFFILLLFLYFYFLLQSPLSPTFLLFFPFSFAAFSILLKATEQKSTKGYLFIFSVSFLFSTVTNQPHLFLTLPLPCLTLPHSGPNSVPLTLPDLILPSPCLTLTLLC